MDAITYYLKANLVLIALLGAYALLLRRETWHAARRAWLLASASLALALPFVPMDSLSPAVIQFDLPEVTISGVASVSAGIDRVPALILVHLAVTAALLILLFVRCIRAWRSVMDPSDADDARSFFRWIQLPREVHGPDRAALLAHERVHATHGHSFDVVLFELSAAFFWSNPVSRIALRELRLVHELQADAIARHAHPRYEALLLAQALRVPSASLLNTFGSSNLKHRMTMLQNHRSPRAARRKLLFALPALALALGLTAWRTAPSGAAPEAVALTYPGHEQQPEFPGGQEGLMKYMTSSLRYPEKAKLEGVQGKVFVAFTVKSSGQVADATVKRGVRADLDAEALRVVRAMPNWKPAQSGGKAVDAQMTLPIAFQLQ